MKVHNLQNVRPLCLAVFVALWLFSFQSLLRAEPAERQDELTQIVRTSNSTLSVRLPQGWQARDGSQVLLTSALIFGDSAEALQTAADGLAGANPDPSIVGAYGLVGMIDPQLYLGLSPDIAASTFMSALLENVGLQGGQILEQSSYMLGGQYPGVLSVINLPAYNATGHIGTFVVGRSVIEIITSVTPASDFQAKRDILLDILDTVRFPAESSAVVQPTVMSPTQPAVSTQAAATPGGRGLGGIQPVAPAAATLVRAGDDRLSIELPDGWTVRDLVADDNTLAYGDTSDAAQARLASARPDLAEAVAMSGSGGLVILYPMADIGVDPDSPDLDALMQQLLAQLQSQGYSLLEPPQPFEIDGSPGVYAVLDGTETGFLALVAFGDEVAYITATSASADFAANRDTLMSIMQSVHAPAVEEVIPPTPTEPPPPTATPAGLGGLGSLGSATATSTP